jgi:hypothetical protein
MHDQLRSYYCYLHKEVRNWMPCFIFGVEIAITNGFNISQLARGKQSHLVFRLKLIQQYFNHASMLQQSELRQTRSKKRKSNRKSPKPVFTGRTMKLGLPSCRLDPVHHEVWRVGKERHGRCYCCRLKGRGNKSYITTAMCTHCNVYLCKTKKRDCFKAFHSPRRK